VNRTCGNSSQPVAFIAYPTLDSLMLFYALLEIGRTALPLNPRFTLADNRTFVVQAGAVQVSYESERLEIVHQACFVPSVATLRPPTLLVPTNGSTGRAKLVRLSEKALIAAAESSAERLEWFPNDRWLLSVSLCHIGGLSIVTRCLLGRVPTVIGDSRGGPAEIDRAVHGNGVTLVSLVSPQLHRLLASDHRLRKSPLRLILLGGMTADPWIVAAARSSHIPVLTTYGMTEFSSQIATQLPTDMLSLIGPCHDVGPPIRNVDVKIVNDEIVVRGPMLFDGYDTDASPTAELSPPVSIHGPASAGPVLRNGWFHTGDWGRISETGRLRVLGRFSDRIITGEDIVAPAEVEWVLESLPSVERACVFGIPDAAQDEQVAAAIILREGYTLNWTEFRAQVEQRLAAFKRPRAVAIVSQFVTRPSGKLDRAATALESKNRLQRISDSG